MWPADARQEDQVDPDPVHCATSDACEGQQLCRIVPLCCLVAFVDFEVLASTPEQSMSVSKADKNVARARHVFEACC